MSDSQNSKNILKNPGFAFGYLKEKPELVKLVPLVVTGGLFAYWKHLMGKEGHEIEKLGTSIALAGGISNTKERLEKGYVVDDIPVKMGQNRTFYCNKADIAIWTGGLIMVIGSILDRKKTER